MQWCASSVWVLVLSVFVAVVIVSVSRLVIWLVAGLVVLV
jgi:hypothetical protein